MDTEEQRVKDKVSIQLVLRKNFNVKGRADIMNNYIILCMRQKKKFKMFDISYCTKGEVS